MSGRPRHFGDPQAEYEAAVGSVALHDRSDHGWLRMAGRDPARMLEGVVTSSLPAPEQLPGGDGSGEGRRGRVVPSAILTPKGRPVSDLRLFRTDTIKQEAEGDAESGASYLLDLPAAGAGPVRDHLARYVPPRFATVEDVTEATGMITVLGPGAAGLLADHLTDGVVSREVLEGLEEGEYRVLGTEGPAGGTEPLRVVRSGEVAAAAFDVVGSRGRVDELSGVLTEGGATRVGVGVWETLRVEAGRPLFGVDFDEDTILLETGLGDRLIDHAKGCYTGQEVVVRIRDRGHVNRHLRGLRLSPDGPTPPAGTELFAPEERGERSAGELTTVVESPRRGRIALGYVRREVDPGGTVRVGSVDGPEAEVVELEG